MKKGFFISLAVGVITLSAVGIIVAQNTGSQEQPEHLAQIEQGAKTPGPKAPEVNPETVTDGQTVTDGPIVEAPVKTEKPKEETQKPPKKTPETKPEKKPKDTTQASQVMTGKDSVKKLSFKEEDGLIWPILGDVVLTYSMDKSIYFKTLGQYKCNPALVIEAKEGNEVLSAAKCIVTDVSENEETGVTLTADLGDGYEVVYGQLNDVKAKAGDVIEKGSVIGTIAKPTKYYIDEGTNLYFKILEDGEPVDPLLLLE